MSGYLKFRLWKKSFEWNTFSLIQQVSQLNGVVYMKQLYMIFVAALLIAAAPNGKNANSAAQNPNLTPQLQLDVDQTDTLAIPLDNSEEDEKLEMEKLEQIQKRMQMKKDQAKG